MLTCKTPRQRPEALHSGVCFNSSLRSRDGSRSTGTAASPLNET